MGQEEWSPIEDPASLGRRMSPNRPGKSLPRLSSATEEYIPITTGTRVEFANPEHPLWGCPLSAPVDGGESG